jgi:8-oxo-dGTP pyrophosphatase MutT (NUDIX family)
MDLTTLFGDDRLKIRTVGLIQSPEGYIFERHPEGYLFALGGKIMINESSSEALRREAQEEIGMEIHQEELQAVIENFFQNAEGNVHEINFVFRVKDIFMGELPEGFVAVPKSDIAAHDIRPKHLKELLVAGESNFRHYVTR